MLGSWKPVASQRRRSAAVVAAGPGPVRFVSQRLRMLSSAPRQQDLQLLRELLEAGKVTPAVQRTLPGAPGSPGHPASG